MSEQLVLQKLTGSSFKPFGCIVESTWNGFVQVLHQPEAAGWQAAINRVTASQLESLHYHPDTWECFSPLAEGLALAVAPEDTDLPSAAAEALKHIVVFALDAPVCVAPGTWHSLLWLPPQPTHPAHVGEMRGATAFVCENAQVTGVMVHFDQAIAVGDAVKNGDRNMSEDTYA